jgi:predicted DNA-binding WGR domain protein
MRKHLKYINGTADKFWQIEVNDLSFTVTYGKNGTSGTTQTKTFESADFCMGIAEKLVAEKLKKGYSDSSEFVINAGFAKLQAMDKPDLKAIIAQFDSIREDRRIEDLLPFLQQFSKGNKEGLKKHIKKCRRDPNYQWWNWNNSYKYKILTLSAIALFDKTEIAGWNEAFHLLNDVSDKVIFDIVEWAKPNWIDTLFLDRIKKQRWTLFDYFNLRLLEENNLINYNPELFASCICTYREVHDYKQKNNHKAMAYIELLVNDSIAYQRDIPEIFNYETDIHNHNYALNINGKHETHLIWDKILTRLIAENKLDKQFFIENCLQIQTKEWNNNLKAFFRKRLEDLNLSGDDLIPFQETIFTYFHASFPQIVLFGVENVKQLYQNPSFNTASFLEWIAPIMMRADCKTTIKSLLQILEKINKATPQYSSDISLLIADIFVIPDMALQERAAKILLKIANKNDHELKDKLTIYASEIQGQARILLQDFLVENEEFSQNRGGYELYEFAPPKEQLLTQKVVLPTDWNEILFQFGKFINSSDVLDAEILLNCFITQRHLFPDDFTEQLQPYFKQLERKYFEGVYKQIMKSFLMQKIVHLHKSVVLNRQLSNRAKTIALFADIVLKADNKIQNNSELPLLSMPTHAPYWIEPKTLIERLIVHQNTKEGIDRVDFCIAISRMPRENVEEAAPLLAQLSPEVGNLLAFCLGISRKIEFIEPTSVLTKVANFIGGNTPKPENVALWAVAARTFYPNDTFKEFENTYLADVPFVVEPFNAKPIHKEMWNNFYNLKDIVRSPSWYELTFDLSKFQSVPNYLLYSLDATIRGKTWDHRLFYEEDTNYWHSVLPQNSESLALNLIGFACKTADSGANELKSFLNIVTRPEFWFSDITTLVFACCFFQEKKDIRFMSTEVLIHLIDNKKINAEQLGEKLAFLINGKYGVLLRFIDALTGIKDVSPRHNSALFIVLDTVFKDVELEDKLPTNFKKLVEHYADIIAKTKQKPSFEAINFFDKWAENAALKGLIKQIKLAI